MIKFTTGDHHLYLQPQQDPQHQWLTTSFQLVEEEIDVIIWDWHKEWKKPVVYDLFFIETKLQ